MTKLLKLAEQGKLREPEVLADQVKRMLADPRFKKILSELRGAMAGHGWPEQL